MHGLESWDEDKKTREKQRKQQGEKGTIRQTSFPGKYAPEMISPVEEQAKLALGEGT